MYLISLTTFGHTRPTFQFLSEKYPTRKELIKLCLFSYLEDLEDFEKPTLLDYKTKNTLFNVGTSGGTISILNLKKIKQVKKINLKELLTHSNQKVRDLAKTLEES